MWPTTPAGASRNSSASPGTRSTRLAASSDSRTRARRRWWDASSPSRRPSPRRWRDGERAAIPPARSSSTATGSRSAAGARRCAAARAQATRQAGPRSWHTRRRGGPTRPTTGTRRARPRLRGSMPRGYAPGSISAGFQGTHGPRRAWNTPPRQAAALSGAGGRSQGCRGDLLLVRLRAAHGTTVFPGGAGGNGPA